MDQTDISKRKPRQARGTPAYYHRNRFAFAFIAGGTLIFAALASIPKLRRVNKELASKFQYTEEELDRRALFNFPAPRTRSAIEGTIAEAKHLQSER